MKKFLGIFLAIPFLGFAKDVYVGTISCGKYQFSSTATTLQNIKDNCQVKENLSKNGLAYLTFINDSTGKEIDCYFVDNSPSDKINHCN